MKTRYYIYFLIGFCFVLLQTTLLPWFLPFGLKPDLLLILIVYLGLHEAYVSGGVAVYILGCLEDVFVGTDLGLYGLTLLVLFLIGRSLAGRFNAESSLLLLIMVLGGTVLQGLVLILALGLIAGAGFHWQLILGQLPLQVPLNLLAALILLIILPWLHRRLMPRLQIPGIEQLSR